MQTAGFCIFIEVYNYRWRMFHLTDFLLPNFLSYPPTFLTRSLWLFFLLHPSFVPSFVLYISVLVYTFVFSASHSLS